MAGLSSLTSDSSTVNTELPSWYSGAQQQAIDMARQGALATPTAENTVGQQAVDILRGQNNPFSQAQNTLGTISRGVTDAFTTDAQGNRVANPNSPLGALYNQQQQTLMDTILPATDAQSTAAAIGSGNFGSLRGLTAANKARADAYNTLASNQLQNLLQAQTQGTQAATALSNVGAQNIDEALKAGQWQQVSPLAPASAFGKVLSGLGNVGSKATTTAKASPLKTAGTLGSLLTDSPLARSAIGAVLGQDLSRASTSEVLQKIWGGITGRGSASGGAGGGGGGANRGGGGGSSASPTWVNTYPLAGGGSLVMRPDGTQTIYGPNGEITNYDASGEIIIPNEGAEGNFDPGTLQDQYEAEGIAHGGDDYGYEGYDSGYEGYDSGYEGYDSGYDSGGGSYDDYSDYWA